MHILFLAHRAPWPPDRGDRIRSWNVLRHLATRARVHLVALDEAAVPPAPELAALLASCTIVRRSASRPRAVLAALATGRPVSVVAWSSAAVRRAVADVLAREPIEAVYAFSGQMAQYLPADAADLRTVMDFVDVDSAKFAALATTARAPLGWLMAREARLLGRVERDVAAQVSASVFVSAAEADLFRAGGGAGRVEVVENGVDTVAYNPAGVVPHRFDRPTIVFTGQMDYAPNVEAATWLARSLLPALRERRDVAVAIVGRAPTAAVRALAGSHVEVIGEVPDTRPWIAGAAACVAPLWIARGVQNKVLEAMAMARPVVASAAAAEGIDHAGTIRVADGVAASVAALDALLTNPAAAARLGEAARQRVIDRYGWDARLAPLDALLGLTT